MINKVSILISFVALITMSSCATMFGGARYNARVRVDNASGTTITYKGKVISNNAVLSIKRKHADKVSFEVSKEGYKTEKFDFRKKEFRSIALIASIFSGIGSNTQTNNGVTRTQLTFIPYVLIDIINYSSLWKPSLSEAGVYKKNYNNYEYILNYRATPTKKPKKTVVVKEEKKESFQSTAEKLRDLKQLHDEGVINDEEFKFMKSKIIGLDADYKSIEANPKTDVANEPSKEETVEKTQEEENKAKETTEKEESKTEETTSIKEEKTEEAKEKEVEAPKKDTNKEKLRDLNKMLELGLITEKEYQEMKEKLIQ